MRPLQEVKPKFVELYFKTAVFFFFSFADLCIYPTSCWVGTIPKCCNEKLLLLSLQFFLEAGSKEHSLEKVCFNSISSQILQTQEIQINIYTFAYGKVQFLCLAICSLLIFSHGGEKKIIGFTYYGHTNCVESIISNQKSYFPPNICISHSQ